ncbi:MAG: hypothetical protein KDE08_01465 [Rhodobacteraceae bacterium]|nr:hypothetical protein [Paracoccaceae bacterium]
MSKYAALTDHLSSRAERRVPMSFADLEKLLGFELPNSARSHRPWWANSAHGHVQARGWLDAGYQSEQVDLEKERLVFVRLNKADTIASGGAQPTGNHPLLGCMAGTITIPEGVDLTEPAYSDDEMDVLLDDKAARLRGDRT